MRIKIDRDLCVGHALCLDVEAAGIDLDDEEKAYIIPGSEEIDRAVAESAVRSCPQLAISIVEE